MVEQIDQEEGKAREDNRMPISEEVVFNVGAASDFEEKADDDAAVVAARVNPNLSSGGSRAGRLARAAELPPESA